MTCITLSTKDIEAAPSGVRRWLEQEIALGLGTQLESTLSGRKLPSDEAIQQLIAARAFELWESQGRPNGHDLINWRQAEQEIISSEPTLRS